MLSSHLLKMLSEGSVQLEDQLKCLDQIKEQRVLVQPMNSK